MDEGGNESLHRLLSDIPVSGVTAAAQGGRELANLLAVGCRARVREEEEKKKTSTHKANAQSSDMHHYLAGRLKRKFSWFLLSLIGLI